MNKALFLDRDGVINRERGDYTYEESQFELLPGVAEAILTAKQRGFLVIVISNQGGIAKGRYSKNDIEQLHTVLQAHVEEEVGVLIDSFYFCPHHDALGKCLCRKPSSLMFEKAIAKFNINVSESLMLGDSQRDIDAAQKTGIKGVLVEPNSNLLDSVKSFL